jgi:LPXTG-motif cell wall-anchored protein
MRTAGFIIFVIGLGLTIFTTFQFFSKEKVVDIGSIEITREKPHSISWSPLIGIAVMGLGGGLFLWKASKKR